LSSRLRGVVAASLIALSLAAVQALAQSRVYRGEVLSVVGVVRDELGNPVAGATVQLLDGGDVMASTSTGPDGSFTLSWRVPSNFPLGPKTLTVAVPEQPDLYVESSSTSVSVEVWALVTIEAEGPGRVHRGESVRVQGRVEGVTSGTVELRRGSSVLATGSVSGGRFSLSFTVPSGWERGPISLTVTPAGGGEYTEVKGTSLRMELWVRPTIEIVSVEGG